VVPSALFAGLISFLWRASGLTAQWKKNSRRLLCAWKLLLFLGLLSSFRFELEPLSFMAGDVPLVAITLGRLQAGDA
jgi:hypothetical protein